MKRILLSAVMLSSIGVYAQKVPEVKTSNAVGIETTTPRATLDVNGDARLQKVEKMTTSTPTEEIFKDCPCVLTIDKFGVIHRIPKDQFVLAGGSTSGGSQGGTTGNPGGSQGGGNGSGGNQSTGGADLGTTVNAIIKDQEDYVVSFIYNGQEFQGKIDNNEHKISIKIPYTNGNGKTYSSAESKTTTTTASAEDGNSSPITMTIKEGTLTSGDGNIEAEITTPALYNVKKLAPGEEEKIAEFKYTVNNQTKKVVLKAVGGVPDKQFDNQVNGEYKHKFVYIPITVTGTHNVDGKPYSKVWLNQNLGADYANLNGGHFSPKKIGGDDHHDYKAYGSMFQWGRVDDSGYELMDWSKSGFEDDKRLFPNAPWRAREELTEYTDPCPIGFHTPNIAEWEDLNQAITGERRNGLYGRIYKDKSLNLPIAGSRVENDGTYDFYHGNYDGLYWSTTIPEFTFDGSDAMIFTISSTSSSTKDKKDKNYGLSVRCVKDGQ